MRYGRSLLGSGQDPSCALPDRLHTKVPMMILVEISGAGKCPDKGAQLWRNWMKDTAATTIAVVNSVSSRMVG
jgi:hypothetical protein